MPQTKDEDPIAEAVKDLKDTNLYSNDFLRDLENGLRLSSYVTI